MPRWVVIIVTLMTLPKFSKFGTAVYTFLAVCYWVARFFFFTLIRINSTPGSFSMQPDLPCWLVKQLDGLPTSLTRNCMVRRQPCRGEFPFRRNIVCLSFQ